MTTEEALKMLTAKVECMKRESSGEDLDCNHRNCDECELCYAQGTTGEQIEALKVAIEALRNSTGTSDIISRQAAIDAVIAEGRNVDSRYLESERIVHEADAVEAISMLPSAQPEIVHCKNCCHYPSEHTDCPLIGWGRNEDDFCSMAERRTDE